MSKMNKLPKHLQKAMIDNDMVDRHIHLPNANMVVKHGVDRTKKKNQSYVEITTTSSFYSEAELVRSLLNEEAKRAFVMPAYEVDPSTVVVVEHKMTPSEKAFMLARKYRFEDETKTLKAIFLGHLKKEMNQYNIDRVHKIVASLKATKLDPVDN